MIVFSQSRSCSLFYHGVVTVQASMPWFYYGKAWCYTGCLPWCPGDCWPRHCYAPAFAGIENDSIRGEPGHHRDEPGCQRVYPVYHGIASVVSRFVPVLPWFSQVYDISPGLPWLYLKKGTSRQRSGKGAIRKRFPLQKPRWEKTKQTIRY